MFLHDSAVRGSVLTRTGLYRPSAVVLARIGEEAMPALAALLPPTATMAWAVAVWALLAQIAVAANFPIQSGALADWRVWLLIAAGLQLVSMKLAHQQNGNDRRG